MPFSMSNLKKKVCNTGDICDVHEKSNVINEEKNSSVFISDFFQGKES